MFRTIVYLLFINVVKLRVGDIVRSFVVLTCSAVPNEESYVLYTAWLAVYGGMECLKLGVVFNSQVIAGNT